MLVAKVDNGEFLSLYHHSLEKDVLLKRRKQHLFFCPACNEEVILKLGDKHLWHFAHKKKLACNDEIEGETIYHIKGKRMLYYWLVQQSIHVQLEPYIQNIRQRPDLLIRMNDTFFAIEFQCAKIPPEIFTKRTLAYQKHNITPIWILGGNQLKRLKTNFFQMNSFHWLFTYNVQIKKDRLQLLSLCPETKNFIRLNNMMALSTNRSIALPTIHPLHLFSFSDIFQTINTHTPINDWFQLKSMWRKYRKNKSKSQQFLRSLYSYKGYYYSLFPSEAGVPSLYHSFIETPTYIWQSWLLDMFIVRRSIGEKIHLNLMKRAFLTLAKNGTFQLRELPLIGDFEITSALKEYLYFLCYLNIIVTVDGEVFIKKKEVSMPITEEEALARDRVVAEVFKGFKRKSSFATSNIFYK